jgi:hypothetical protein
MRFARELHQHRVQFHTTKLAIHANGERRRRSILDPANVRYLPAALELLQSREAIRQGLRSLLMQQLQAGLPLAGASAAA